MSESSTKVENGVSSKGKTAASGLPKMHSRASSISSVTSEKTVTLSSKLKRTSSSTEILNHNSDDLKIGERVFVNGNKPGHIRFQGETSFAPGQWCGVELEESTGKNDGSVNGVKYFECKPNCGIFVRPYRLTLEPVPVVPSSSHHGPSSGVNGVKQSTTSNNTALPTVNKTVSSLLKVGDKVLVNATSGMKRGTLRYLGSTDFAAGTWAGIELTEATGKNDGSVAGKRYFHCQPNYGLFAPTNKVVKDMVNGSASKLQSQVRKPSNLTTTRKTGTSDSRESLASMTSTTSHRSGRIRLGVTSLSEKSSVLASKREGLSSPSTLSSPSSSLAKTLKEKEDQISHLLQEKDSESTELAKVASRLKAVEEELALVKSEKQKTVQEKDVLIHELEQSIDESKSITKQLMTNIEEERKKAEMLEFRLEEELANKMELKDENERLSAKQRSSSNRDESDELFQLQEEVIKKDEKLIQLETTLDKNKNEVRNLLQRIKEFETNAAIGEQRQSNYLQTIDELNLELKKSQTEAEKMREDLTRVNEESRKLRENMDEILRRSGDDSGQIQALVDKLKRSDEEKRGVEIELQALRSELDNQEEAKKEMDNELAKMKKMLQDRDSKEIEIVNREKQLNEELKRKVEKIQELEQHLENTVKSHGNNDEQLHRMSEELKTKQKVIDELHEKLNKLNTQVDKFNHEVTVIKEENDSLKKSVESKGEESGEFKSKISSLENDLKSRQEDNRALEEQVSDLLKKITDGNSHLIHINEDLKKKQQEIDNSQETISNLKKSAYEQELEKKKLQSELNEMRRKESEKSVELETTQKKRMETENEINTLMGELKNLKEKIQELERENRKLTNDLDTKQKGLESRDKTISKLKEQIQSARAEFDEVRQSFESKLDQSKVHGDSAVQELRKQVEILQSQNKDVSSENERLNHDMKKLMDEIKSVQTRHKEVLNEFEEECKRLERHLAEKDKVIAQRSEQIEQIKADNQGTIEKWRTKMEQEKENLLSKINQLESAINSTKNESAKINGSSSTGESSDDSPVSDEEREGYESQIGFLNSVIVDMQKRNEELAARIQVLEEMGLSEFEESSTNAMLNGGSLPKAPRLFCDICDMFDKHDTEDCPRQVNNGDDYASHSHYNGKRDEQRPYCANCEMFGHWTTDCNDNESF